MKEVQNMRKGVMECEEWVTEEGVPECEGGEGCKSVSMEPRMRSAFHDPAQRERRGPDSQAPIKVQSH